MSIPAIYVVRLIITFKQGVSCGIPDFRSRDGLYASLKDRGEYDLDDPQQMYDVQSIDSWVILGF